MTSPVPVRPTAVSVAFWFQVALVGLLLLVIGVSIADAVHYDGLIDQASRIPGTDPSEVSSERDSNLGWTLVSGLPLLVLVIWLGVTTIFVGRGSNVARVLTWVGLGAPVVLGLLACLFGGLVGVVGLFAFASLAEPLEDGPEFDPEGDPEAGGEIEFEDGWSDSDFYDRLYDLDSGGLALAYDAVRVFALASAALLAIAVVVLLATRGSSRWFRPDQGQPPMTYAGPAPYHLAGAQPYHPPAPMPVYPPTPPGVTYPAPPHQHPWAPPWGAPPPWTPPAAPPPAGPTEPPPNPQSGP